MSADRIKFVSLEPITPTQASTLQYLECNYENDEEDKPLLYALLTCCGFWTLIAVMTILILLGKMA